jgi:hypothetical protein
MREIRMIKDVNGESYVNINDLEKMMWRIKWFPHFTSLSVCVFIKTIIRNLKEV